MMPFRSPHPTFRVIFPHPTFRPFRIRPLVTFPHPTFRVTFSPLSLPPHVVPPLRAFDALQNERAWGSASAKRSAISLTPYLMIMQWPYQVRETIATPCYLCDMPMLTPLFRDICFWQKCHLGPFGYARLHGILSA